MAGFSTLYPKNKEKNNHLKIIKNNAAKIHKDRVLYSFTDHGLEHSERMIVFCDELIKGNSPSILNDTEKFLLVSAIYLHDIGIQCQKYDCLQAFVSSKAELTLPDIEDHKNINSFIRDNHHSLSAFWVEQNVNKTNLFPEAYCGDPFLGQILATVIESHGESINEIPACNESVSYQGDNIRLALICTLLSLADALDCDCRRIDFNKTYYYELPQESRIHWYKHYYTASIRVNKKLIEIKYRFPKSLTPEEQEVYCFFFSHTTKKWIEHIQSSYIEILNEANIAFNISEGTSSFTGNLKKLKDEDFRYIEEQCVKLRENQTPAMKKVVVGICKHAGNVLMVKRRIHEGSLVWQFPAGTIKPGISEETTIIKEVKEETGIECLPIQRLGERIQPDTKVPCSYWVVKYINGDIYNGDTDENVEVQWVSLENYAHIITSNIFEPIKKYLKGDAENEK